MAPVGEINVVPSGKVYRQIFDAEVQLVRSLHEARNRVPQYGTSMDSGEIYVTDTETRPVWEDSTSPVWRRETSPCKKRRESEVTAAAREVRGLRDRIGNEKKDSGILQRIAANRQERHDAALSELHKELAAISKETEALVLETGWNLQEQLSESDKKIDLLFGQTEDSVNSTGFTSKDLEEFWAEVAEESRCRRRRVKETERTLFELEEKRARGIADVLKKSTRLLIEIYYLMPSDVYRLIHEEAMMINQAILANHRAVAKLSINLMEAELKKENSQRLRWQDMSKAWKCYQQENIVVEFREYVNNEVRLAPISLEKEVDAWIASLKSLNEKRMEILSSISNFVPPVCTKTEVSEWYTSITALTKQIESLNKQFLDRSINFQKEVYQKWVKESKNRRDQLVSLNICNTEEAENLISSELRALTQGLQSKHNTDQEQWEASLKTLERQTDLQIKKLLKFSKKAVHLWDVLEISLSRENNSFQDKMENRRQKYDRESQEKEVNLGIILDTLRQESTRERLQSMMGKALASLKDIKAGYERFHKDQIKMVNTFPALVMKELIAYSTAVSKYFCVKEVFGQGGRSNICEQQITGQANEGAGSPPVGVASGSLEDIPRGETVYHTKAVENQPVEETDSNVEDKGSKESPEGDTGRQDTEELPTGSGEELQENLEGNSIQPNGEQLFQDSESPGKPTEAIPPISDGPAAQDAAEIFTTSSGNTYTVLRSEQNDDVEHKVSFDEQAGITEAFMTEAMIEDYIPSNLEVMAIPENFFTELKEKIRLGFFEHLERWLDESVSRSHSVVVTMKEKLESELKVFYQIHEPRSKRIEMDIHNVRAAELLLHDERVDLHCDGVTQSLNQLKNRCSLLIEDIKRKTTEFCNEISGMETVFLNSNKSNKLVALNNSLPSMLDRHVTEIKTTIRNYRQRVEESLGTLRDTNSDFINSFRLFSEGGNFSPDEIEILRNKIHKASATIASFEGSIILDLEGLESVCLQQATDVVKRFEDKFLSLTTDMIFLENIQRVLTNLQVKIKVLVTDSNSQSQRINTYLDQLRKKTDACAHPNIDKEGVTSDQLYAFSKTIMSELAKRSFFLSCLVEPRPVLSETPLQGPIAAAASRLEVPLRQESRVALETPDNLLNPSRIGKLAVDDAVVNVIKNIMKSQKTVGDSQHGPDNVSSNQPEEGVQRPNPPIIPHPPSRPTSDALSKRKAGKKHMKTSTPKHPPINIRKLVKPTRFDEKYQVFGEKKEESENFKGMVTAILWEGNDALLYTAEEFYKKKDKRTASRPDLLQKTFEECADMVVLKLQSYEKQAQEYHNNCLMEFREQLERFEKLLSEVPSLVIEDLRRQHLHNLQTITDQIRQLFRKDFDRWDLLKEKRKNLLRPSLGHPENSEILEDLCRQEELRQEEETRGIEDRAKNLHDCALECRESFIASLASLTETMLLEFDEALTVDDVVQAKTKTPKEKLSTLIRLKQAGLPLENAEYQPLIERGSRVWPGILHVKSSDAKHEDTSGFQSTATVTTAKTTLSHLSTVESRDSAYKKFIQDTETELAKIKEEKEQQFCEAQRWREWWRQSIQKIKELYL
ncbi:coiled-coil domain-containing protein 180 [Spea bombifrons]|uniref:coiled-coil domain-containing protein 180 n=1 Tax=Spea bombifrons TaxID=233779 RepID=UPI00234AD607|nr:coiled-coil domain-containing protein 180 [Spea bombifrons]